MSMRSSLASKMKNSLRKLILASASTTFAVAGPCGITSSTTLENEGSQNLDPPVFNEEEVAWAREYDYSVGYYIPYRISPETAVEQIREETIELGLEVILEYISAPSIIGVVRQVAEKIPSVGNTATFDWYVLSEDDATWRKNTTIDSDESFSVMLVYNQGDEMPHALGIGFNIIDKTGSLDDIVGSRTLLKAGEENGLRMPPNILVSKKSMSLEPYLNSDSFLQNQFFQIGGTRGDPANITVRLNSYDDGNGDSGNGGGSDGGNDDVYDSYDGEPNGTFGEAIPLELNRSATGRGTVSVDTRYNFCEPSDPLDIYSFYLSAGSEIIVNVKNRGGSFCSFLFDENQHQIFWPQKHGAGKKYPCYAPEDEDHSEYVSLPVKVESGGTYYLSMNAHEGTTGTYEFKITKK